ncbi:hypothetical protein LT493_15415 [Streptomyces tricolor]|nr:hypothetical protein [Streptomyces tricolor]
MHSPHASTRPPTRCGCSLLRGGTAVLAPPAGLTPPRSGAPVTEQGVTCRG